MCPYPSKIYIYMSFLKWLRIHNIICIWKKKTNKIHCIILIRTLKSFRREGRLLYQILLMLLLLWFMKSSNCQKYASLPNYPSSNVNLNEANKTKLFEVEPTWNVILINIAVTEETRKQSFRLCSTFWRLNSFFRQSSIYGWVVRSSNNNK